MQWITENWFNAVSLVLGVVGVVGVVLAVVFYFKQKSPKQLDYQIMDDVQMTLPNVESLHETLEVSWGKKKLTDPRIVVVRILNTGKRAISAQDFKGGQLIQIQYEDNAFFDAGIVRASPGLDITDIVDVVGSVTKPYFSPALLNPGEWFDAQLFSDGPHGEITVTSRFSDQQRSMRKLGEVYRNRQRILIRSVVAMLCIAIVTTMTIGIATGSISAEQYEATSPADAIVTIINTVIFVGIGVLGVLYLRNLKRYAEYT